MPRVTLLELSAPPTYFYLPKYRQLEQFLFGKSVGDLCAWVSTSVNSHFSLSQGDLHIDSILVKMISQSSN